MELRNILRFVPLLVCAAGTVLAAPPLTQIQDILYKADGTRFNGTLTVRWKNFQANNNTTIAVQALNLNIVDGVLRTNLVPTIGASPGANYEVTYQSSGRFLFTELWAVPSSTQALRVRDIRVSTGTIVGTPAVVGQLVQIGDISGLEQELLLRPMRGAGFGIGRAAIINAAGQLEVAQGNLSDCVRVDGSSGGCGSGGIGGTVESFVDQEVPTGLVNGSNATFTLTQTPTPASSLALFRNGLLMRPNLDFTISGNTVTFFAASLPQVGDNLLASYRALGSPSGGSVPRPAEVLCAGSGLTTPATALTTLGVCIIPANALSPGDHVQVQFLYSREGAPLNGFTAEVRWGSTQLLTRTYSAAEFAVNGTAELAIQNAPYFWFSQNSGIQTGLSATSGDAFEGLNSTINVSFLGAMTSAAGGNSVTLRSFRVLRYPTVTAP